MARHWPTLERIVRWLKPSAESFAAAAAVYGPEVMLQLGATKGVVDGRRLWAYRYRLEGRGSARPHGGGYPPDNISWLREGERCARQAERLGVTGPPVTPAGSLRGG